MSKYSIRSTGFSGGVHLVIDPHPLDDTTVNFGAQQRGSAIQAQNSAPTDHYAAAVSVSGTFIVASVPGEEKVEVHQKIDGVWTYMTTLSSGDWGDEFGHSVTVSDNKIVVGAPNSNNGAGAVYAWEYKANVWRPTIPAKLEATNKADEPSARFGTTVELTGNTLIIGAPEAFGGSTNGDRFGAIYGWTYRNYARLWAPHVVTYSPTPQHDSGFGSAISVENENFLVVGAPRQNVTIGETITGAGTVFVFARQVADHGEITTWEQTMEVRYPVPAQDMFFGKSVNYAGDRLIVGAPGAADGGTAAYFYGRPDSLTYVQDMNARSVDGVITDSTVSAGDMQGAVVFGDPSSQAFMVGAPGNQDKGAIYLYEQTEAGTWKPASISKLQPSDGQTSDAFGNVFAYYGGQFVVGVPYRDGGKGGFYLFS